MKIEEIEAFLNPEGDMETSFHIRAAIEHIQAKTNRSFTNDCGELDLPADLVRAVNMLVESTDVPGNIQSESVGGELSVTYFSGGAMNGVREYWLPYRRVSWNGGKSKR